MFHSDLHSTMLLLYRITFRVESLQFSIYIPLCFYYIIQECGIVCDISYLHSTMLLLYRIDSKCSVASSEFTFHYASTISEFADSFMGVLILIYIPLCFYYINCSHVCYVVNEFIYIPLCFYYIQTGKIGKVVLVSIYIPLCFYYIHVWSSVWAYNVKFTFHYASTISYSTLWTKWL